MALKAKQNKLEKNISLQGNPPFALVESFRNLYTNTNFAIPKKENGHGRIICISSALAGEGKTTVSVNFAISCASAGTNTILLDGDMRKPSVRSYITAETHSGMVEFLSGQTNLEEAVTNIRRNFDVVAGRKPAPNPLRLIQSNRFEEMLDRLSEKYEYVIIDTPPLSIVSDALAIAKYTDGLVLVARQMVSTTPILQQVVSDIEFSDVNFLGFVLNAYESKNAGKGYNKNYYYDNYQSKDGGDRSEA